MSLNPLWFHCTPCETYYTFETVRFVSGTQRDHDILCPLGHETEQISVSSVQVQRLTAILRLLQSIDEKIEQCVTEEQYVRMGDAMYTVYKMGKMTLLKRAAPVNAVEAWSGQSIKGRWEKP